MPLDEKARYTMRIDRDLLEKFGYICLLYTSDAADEL